MRVIKLSIFSAFVFVALTGCSVTKQSAAPSTTETSGVKMYTMKELSQHNSKASCYAAINGSVYNLTAWIDKHPGGATRILSICGKDGSSAFNDQHTGQARPANELAGFKIGELST